MEMGFGMGLGMGTGNWTPDADKSLGCRRLSAPAGPTSQHFKSKLRMAKPGMGISTRGLQKSRSPEVPGSKLDRNHEISLQQSLLAASGDKLNCAYSCINCTHTREDGVAGPPECVN